ncbi:adenylate/guanylate cyclase domain-containing protein [Bradyrhizobium sp. JYMT SZCCT0180]|uniref:CHASE2 domain-containing protein n=1 Tax=Bradyrhizobium sp. JYMT SZCCT0180 TaxID=2807666 RepID=UPI001BA91638|nr:adenylate/guanylate cyclase domain-containing protein [Bradyrhizobium sp. JYMT SZCCT0180]MBR1213987.1 adenylate/guanylate cyclase domain-containing protein [Bradyrhizobium sp. JYMT SZCCT0180]
MLSRLGKTHSGLIAGLLALALFLAAILLMPREWRNVSRERAFDVVLAADRQIRRSKPQETASAVPVVVVDIDRRTLDDLGPWPWPRETMARLVEAVASGKPAVVGIDVLFTQVDTRSPAALARQLGSLTGNQDISALAGGLLDGDKHLAAALKSVPVALGFVLDADRADAVPGVPVLARRPVVLDGLWRMTGGLGPVSPLVDAAKGLGALSLPGDADGRIRRVPLLVGAGEATRPGLALEAIRLFERAPAYSVDANPQRIIVGDLEVPLPGDGLLRLAGADIRKREARTISAADVVNNSAMQRARLAGAIVLIGGSAPELGGLRETATDPLVPSVEIQADAIQQIYARRAPQALPLGFALTLVMGLIAVVAASALSPVLGAFVGLTALAALWSGAILASLLGDRLIDPVMPSIGGLFVFMTASVSSYALVARREARIRSRFEQHLAPAVVKRIAENPGLLKLSGEKREITALWTDIEDFTAMTHRAGPEQLVAVLDEYIEGMAAIVMKHGGMVDKIVGDSVHAFFNAPLDLKDHPQRALDCAEEIRIWAKEFQSRNEPSHIGFGRTRIGIETGEAIVGDIGIRSKLDYTAHGDSINSAARLEALNKRYGSTICVGPFAAARCTTTLFRPLGVASLRGLDVPVEVFEPWPPEASADWRERYIAAYRLIESDKAGAAQLFEGLAAECPGDPVPRLLAAELRSVLST